MNNSQELTLKDYDHLKIMIDFLKLKKKTQYS